MRNDIILQYRSLHKPRPLWSEQAIYGGYEYIEIAKDVWINRQFEYIVQYALTGTNQLLKTEAMKELKDTSFYFKPSKLQQSDYAKLCLLLSHHKEVCIDKYSYSFGALAQRFPFIKFYTNSVYTEFKFTQISTEELCKRSNNTLTLINSQSYNLKSYLHNWGNVIVYDAELFDEVSLEEFMLKEE